MTVKSNGRRNRELSQQISTQAKHKLRNFQSSMQKKMKMKISERAERPTRTFGANTENNPREECKAVMTRA